MSRFGKKGSKSKKSRSSQPTRSSNTKVNNATQNLDKPKAVIRKATPRLTFTRSGSRDVAYPPYHFVPNPELPPSLSEAVLHHKTHENTFSGELRCELTTVTDAIFAGYQKKFSGEEQLKRLKRDAGTLSSLINIKKMSEKSVLYPLCYEGKTLIAGSSIKGMLRHSISALASAPMLRVQEKTFSYRPNLGNYANAKYITRAAIVVDVDNDEELLRIRVLDSIDSRTDLIYHDKVLEPIQNQIFIYKGGIDDEGALSSAFAEGKYQKSKSVEVKEGARESVRLSTQLTRVGRDVLRLYNLTTDHLCDQQGGHISSRHPKLPNKDSQKRLSDSIKRNRDLEVDQLIFVEVERSGRDFNVISLGNNYHYHWRYKDTLRTINARNGYQLETSNRPETSLLTQEKQVAYSVSGSEYKPSELNVVRALFGFTPDKDQNLSHSDANPDQLNSDAINKGLAGDKYAGRISVNHAIEVPRRPSESVLKINKWAALSSTGSPRASSVEFYVQQEKDDKMTTYGDTTTDIQSRLNGRKFYPHHDGNRFPYEETNNAANVISKLSPLACSVVPAETLYRFSVRFRFLKDWEIGMLLVSINPELLIQDFASDTVDQLKLSNRWIQSKIDKKFIMGNKLGYGRPFGYGSCFINIASAQKTENDKQTNISSEQQKECIEAFLNRFNCEAFDDVLLQWLKLHHLKTEKVFRYPPGNQSDEEATLKFHSKIRTDHIKHRREVVDKETGPASRPLNGNLPALEPTEV